MPAAELVTVSLHLALLVTRGLGMAGGASGSPASSAPVEDNMFRIDKRIVNGESVDITTLPFQVALEKLDPGYICGGAIISAEWIVTAAHCIPGKTGMDIGKLMVRAGSSEREAGGSVHRVVGGERHPAYRDDKVDWDIAVLRVLPPFSLDATRTPVTLADSSDHLRPGASVQVSGWGYERQTAKEAAHQLQRTWLSVVPHSVCRLLYVGVAHITRRMMCAGSLTGKDACTGDSGGPLFVSASLVGPYSGATLYGVVSFGKGCSHVRFPGVFTSLTDKEIRDYIRTVSGL